MADPWKAPEGEEIVPALVPRQLDRYALQSSLADLAHTDEAHNGEDRAPAPTSLKPAMPGTAGHQALAALAAEVAEQAAGATSAGGSANSAGGSANSAGGSANSAGGSAGPSPTGEGEDPYLPAGAPVVPPLVRPPPDAANPQAGMPRARPRPFGGPPAERPAAGPTPGDGPVALVAPGSSPVALVPPGTSPGLRPVARLRTGVDDRAAGAPAMTVPGAVRLSPAGRTGPAAAAADQSTIPLRRRPIANGPVAIAPEPAPRGEATDTGTASKAAVVVEAWEPGEDDILPDRQVRRRRTFRRGR